MRRSLLDGALPGGPKALRVAERTPTTDEAPARQLVIGDPGAQANPLRSYHIQGKQPL
jgi:hypothetical protein